ncbi:MAG: hypothetical protein M3545_15230, partial [Acidobacteriota bacterium]|nr:hypothetical protein [Acidobacteriota bacterium]
MRQGSRRWLARVTPRDRGELMVLLGGVLFLLLLLAVMNLTDEVVDGDTLSFDRHILLALRDPGDPSRPLGPRWLSSAALDIT